MHKDYSWRLGERVWGVRILNKYTRHLAQVGKPAHASGSPIPLNPYTLTKTIDFSF
ncbi:hypothetical protein [Aulosira sp. FACHB-615]|uniref:hypothetical protein n=1 Tax=Nostoc piscinale TaxID=224012 RepID=UPI001683E9FE